MVNPSMMSYSYTSNIYEVQAGGSHKLEATRKDCVSKRKINFQREIVISNFAGQEGAFILYSDASEPLHIEFS